MRESVCSLCVPGGFRGVSREHGQCLLMGGTGGQHPGGKWGWRWRDYRWNLVRDAGASLRLRDSACPVGGVFEWSLRV